MEEAFKEFIESVNEENRHFVLELNDYLMQNNCKCEISKAKSGYLVSYNRKETKKVLATFVFRKSGIKLRIYPEHLLDEQTFLDNLPERVKKEIRKASACKRLLNPDDCNPRCVMGYTFNLDGEELKKCRYMAFMITLNDESNPYIKTFIEKEIEHSKSKTL